MIFRVVAVVAFTICYWFLALSFAGAGLMGACAEDAACAGAKQKGLQASLLKSGLIYFAILAAYGWSVFRKRRVAEEISVENRPD